MDRKRLDKFLVESDHARSRSQAKRLIDNDRVLVDGFPADKPSTLVEPNVDIQITGDEPNWVGRGAKKIWPFLEKGFLEVEEEICLDVGSSTGGFTQALLKAGAQEVHSVDVGYGQLAYKLRTDDRVTVHERTNFRYSDSSDFDSCPQRFTMDVSFISTLKLLDSLNDVTSSTAQGITLIKPQFEAGPDENDEGIVRDPDVRYETLKEVCEGWLDNGWGIHSLTPSPLQGDSGNFEYIAVFDRATEESIDDDRIRKIANDPSSVDPQ